MCLQLPKGIIPRLDLVLQWVSGVHAGWKWNPGHSYVLLGISLGVWVSARFSGGHINPAVCLGSKSSLYVVKPRVDLAGYHCFGYIAWVPLASCSR